MYAAMKTAMRGILFSLSLETKPTVLQMTEWFADMCMDAHRNSMRVERTPHKGEIKDAYLPGPPAAGRALFIAYAKALPAHSISYASIGILRARSKTPVEADGASARNTESEHLPCPVRITMP